jgi:4'-phosphopantetheinyl transferase
MSEAAVWILRVDGLDEAAIMPWATVLDETERARAVRFVKQHNRVEYMAAHVLLRQALAAATGRHPTAFRFEAGAHGKPTAWVGDMPAGVHFNLSHTKGAVALAIAPFEHGLDIEPIDRTVNQEIADHYFCPQEVAWLERLPEPDRAEGFLRLWTLKEAFIKATGRGLSQPLDSFWFDVFPPAIQFAAVIDDDPAAWAFEQRLIDDRFLAAIGFRRPAGSVPPLSWRQVAPADLSGIVGTAVAIPVQSIGEP